MSGRPLMVRVAELSDRYALWLWANDPETRRASFHRPLVPWADHVAWFARQVAEHGCVLIGEGPDAQPVGSIRFDSADGWRTARLSYVIAPESRGQGWSRPLVQAGVAWLRERQPGAAVVAVVMSTNAPSLRVFRALAWDEVVRDDVHEFTFHG